MRVPTPPGKSGDPKPRRPVRRQSRLDRILAADRKARAEQPDLVVRLDVAAPDDATLTALGLVAASRKQVARAERTRREMADRVAADREFGVALASDPGATLRAEHVIAGTGSPGRTARTPVAGVRFELPDAVLGTTADPDRGTLAALALLTQTLTAATASDAAWRAARANPDPVVQQAANAFPWSEHGIEPGSAAAASVTTQALDALRTTLGLPPSAEGSQLTPTVTGPALAVMAAPFDPDRAAATTHSIRVSIQEV